jgi:hypothetical protein
MKLCVSHFSGVSPNSSTNIRQRYAALLAEDWFISTSAQRQADIPRSLTPIHDIARLAFTAALLRLPGENHGGAHDFMRFYFC